jgi:hypothetical protein
MNVRPSGRAVRGSGPLIALVVAAGLAGAQSVRSSAGSSGFHTPPPPPPPNPNLTHSSLAVGGPLSSGSNGSYDPATLSDGSLASADVDFTFDSGTGVLTVVVTNTSPVVDLSLTPVVGDVFLNVPLALAFDTAVLATQTSAGDADPGYAAIVDATPHDDTVDNDTGYFGGFAVRLMAPLDGGVAHAQGNGAPAGAVAGSATFQFQLDGNFVNESQITAEFPRRQFSRPSDNSGMLLSANAVIEFYNGGDGTGGGHIASGAGSCNPIMFWSGDNKVGNVQTLFLQSAIGCHGCVIFSHVFSPSNLVVGHQVDVGGPMNELNIYIAFTQVAVGFQTLPFAIPNDPMLIGETRYWQFVTNPVMGVSAGFENSPVITTTFLP